MIKIYRKYWECLFHNDYRIAVCGWFEYQTKIFDAKQILELVVNRYIIENNDIHADATNFNGNYSIIVERENKTMLVVDRMRTYPVIYFFNEQQLIVTDDLMSFCKEFKPKLQIDEGSCEQFLCSNYIIGPYTIYKDVYSVQSGEIVIIDSLRKSIFRKQYFRWIPNMENDNFERDLNIEANLQNKIFMRVFKRMIDSAPNVHNWVIPLSGGYDSRTIVNYLYILGVKNVICFSYGISQNSESVISKQVAEALGYKWYFVDYNEWVPLMHEENILNEYLRYGFNGTSVSVLQDFVAIYALTKQKVINDRDVIVPGHALDMIAGSHINNSMLKIKDINHVYLALNKHYSNFGYYTGNRRIVKDRIFDMVKHYDIDLNKVPESFNWQERQTKFIANSVKVYEYFGLDWRLPEWDIDLLDYWNKIGFNYRLERKLYKDVFKKILTTDNIKDISFANDLKEKKVLSLKEKVVNITPFFILKMLKKANIFKSMYFVGEGSHLVFLNQKETISYYLLTLNKRKCLDKYLKSYSPHQYLSGFDINSVTTLQNIRNSYEYEIL